MTQSVWPHDHAADAFAIAEEDVNRLSCFVLCPAEPKDLFDGIANIVRSICNQLGRSLGVEIESKRAVEITSSGFIHPEIWQQIRGADIIVADVSGLNGNVLLELGVSAAWHKKEKVIIIRENKPQEPRLFDILPARHIEYMRTPSGFQKLAKDLAMTIQGVLAAAPFDEIPKREVKLPLSLPLTDGVDSPNLWCPGLAHRRILPGKYLEFGSLYNFRYSWITLADLRVKNVRVRADLLFSVARGNPMDLPWMGIMLRSQAYLADKGHLAYMRSDGSVWVTLELQEADGPKHENKQIGQIKGFDPTGREFVPFDISFDDSAWNVKIGPVEWSTSVGSLPFVFGEGRILLDSFFAWVGARSIKVDAL